MHYQSDGTQVAARPAPGPVVGTPGYVTAGNLVGLAPSNDDPDLMNAVVDELCHIVTGLGGTLDKTNSAQIVALLKAFFAPRGVLPGVAAFEGAGSYTFTVPAGVTWIRVWCVGGGGGGSNCQTANGASSAASGGGGGAGGLAVGVFAVIPGQVLAITVGAGGGPQANGTSSMVGTLCGATGGAGTAFAGNNANSSPGGLGGVGVGALLNYAGGCGSDGQSGLSVFAGNGAGGPRGGAGRAGAHGGVPGQCPGAGGGGAYDNSNGTGTGVLYLGGAGHDGEVIIEYIAGAA